MNSGLTITVKKPIEQIKTIFNDKFSIFAFFVFLISDLFGSFLSGTDNNFFLNSSKYIFDSFYGLISCGSFLKIFVLSFLFLSLSYLFDYLLSNGVFGFIFIYISAFIFGLFHGLGAGYAYREFGIGGITLNTLIVVPFCVFNYLLFVYFGSECFLQSIDFLKVVLNKISFESFNTNFKRLLIRFIFTIILCLVISLLFSIFSLLISKFFVLK